MALSARIEIAGVGTLDEILHEWESSRLRSSEPTVAAITPAKDTLSSAS